MSIEFDSVVVAREAVLWEEKRSRRFLLMISIFIALGVGAYFSLFVFEVDLLLVKSFIFVDVFVVVLCVVYWYLQIKPGEFVDRYFSGRDTSVRLRDRVQYIEEIEGALSIFEGGDDQVLELARFISNRLGAFSDAREFCLGGVRHRGFDQQILMDETRLRLFKISLSSLKRRILEDERLEQERDTEGVDGPGKDRSIGRLEEFIGLTTTRLRREIESLSKRANIYIAFGSVITLVAGIVLYFTVQDVLASYSDRNFGQEAGVSSVDILSLATRFSVVVFVEVFAFYYLRLYRGIGEDIRFYQNEITNIEMKIVSMFVAESEESKSALACEFARTERNFIISSKQTTVDLERRKHDLNVLQSSMDSVSKLMKSVKA